MFFPSAVFHESTVAGLKAYGFNDTADFVELIMNLWKISNVKSSNKGFSLNKPCLLKSDIVNEMFILLVLRREIPLLNQFVLLTAGNWTI